MRIEDQILDCAARKLSRNGTAKELGLTPYKLNMMLSAMPPVDWPTMGECVGFKEGRKKYKVCTKGIVLAQQACRDKARRTAFGVTGSINDLAARFSALSGNSVRHRINSGMTIEEALTAPRIAPIRGKPMKEMLSK